MTHDDCDHWIRKAFELFLDQEDDPAEFLAGVPENCQEEVSQILSTIQRANQVSREISVPPAWHDEYHELERLGDGKGAMGIVYLVRPTLSVASPLLAMKIPQLTRNSQFLEEIWNHILIPPHPNLVMWKYMRIIQDQPHIFMEYMDGGSFAELINQSPWTNQEQWLRDFFDVAIQCCWAIEHLHTHRLIHQDIKPENILLHSLEPGYHVALADFGISSFRRPEMETVQAVGLSAAFASPEQRNEGKAFEASDIYCLGKTLLAMLTPVMSLASTLMGVDIESAMTPEPDSIQSLLDEMTQHAPESRPTVTAVIDKLHQLHEEIIGSEYHRQKPFMDDSAELTRSILKELEQPSSVFYDVARLMSDDAGSSKMLAAIQNFYARLLERQDDPARAACMALLIQIIFFRAANDDTLIQLGELETISTYVESFLTTIDHVLLPDTYALEFKEAACPLLKELRPMTDPDLRPEVDRVLALMGCP